MRIVKKFDIVKQIVDRTICKDIPMSPRKRAVSLRLNYEIIEIIDTLSTYLGWSRAKTAETIIINTVINSREYINSLGK